MKLKICGVPTAKTAKDIAALPKPHRPDYLGFYGWPQEIWGGTPATKHDIPDIVATAIENDISPVRLTYATLADVAIKEAKATFGDYAKHPTNTTPYLQMVQTMSVEQLHRLDNRIKDELPGLRIMQSLGWLIGSNSNEFQVVDYGMIDYFLIDSYSQEKHGGTGTPNNWAVSMCMAHLFRRQNKRVALAGGINMSNLQRAMSIVQPDMIDIESGAQDQKGNIDIETVAKLSQQVHSFIRKPNTLVERSNGDPVFRDKLSQALNAADDSVRKIFMSRG